MADVTTVFITLAILVFSICYIAKGKKKEYACIGCLNASNCKKHCHHGELEE